MLLSATTQGPQLVTRKTDIPWDCVLTCLDFRLLSQFRTAMLLSFDVGVANLLQFGNAIDHNIILPAAVAALTAAVATATQLHRHRHRLHTSCKQTPCVDNKKCLQESRPLVDVTGPTWRAQSPEWISPALSGVHRAPSGYQQQDLEFGWWAAVVRQFLRESKQQVGAGALAAGSRSGVRPQRYESAVLPLGPILSPLAASSGISVVGRVAGIPA